ATPGRPAWSLVASRRGGGVLCGAAVPAASTAAVLAITLAGVPLLLAAAGVIRGCANAERGRLRAVLGEPVEARYRDAAGPGMMARARNSWTDPATWRDVA